MPREFPFPPWPSQEAGYFLPDDDKPGAIEMQDNSVILKFCPVCEEKKPFRLAALPEFPLKQKRWLQGELIQNVWPEATGEDLEQLISGVCSNACFDILFPEELNG
jgi:hypothetical protein